jgi:hypothetical protein
VDSGSGQRYWSLNGVCYREHYVEDTAQQLDTLIVAWSEFVTVKIMW